jgi:hypothetical protein
MPRMKQSGSKKTRLTPREPPHDREAGGSAVQVVGTCESVHLREEMRNKK